MMSPRARHVASAFVLCLTALAARAADAKDIKAGWDPVRTTFPATTNELKALQDTVKQVVAKTTPATVGILLGNGAGSGVIVSEDGLILTAAHVIGWAGRDCTLVLPDGTRVRGRTLGVDHNADSGMVKITDPVPKKATWPGASLGKWPSAELGTSGELKKNQWVVSLGHPGGPKPDRRPPVRVGQFLSQFGDSMVSDCTLVGGDSGGPLFDLTGKVIGIHSRIGLTLDNNVHIPADVFKKEWAELADGQTVSLSRYIVGITLRRKTSEDAHPKAVVEDVTPDGPAAKAGLKVGDVVTRISLVPPPELARKGPTGDEEFAGASLPVASSEAYDGIAQVLEREWRETLLSRGLRERDYPIKFRVSVRRDDETKTFTVSPVRRTPQKSRGPASPDKGD